MSKYEPLWIYLKDNNSNEIVLTFEEIKKILNFEIDHSFLNYKKELTNYGYNVTKIFLKDKKVKFTKI